MAQIVQLLIQFFQMLHKYYLVTENCIFALFLINNLLGMDMGFSALFISFVFSNTFANQHE